METFWELLRTSTIVQGCVTLLLVASVVVMGMQGKPIPQEISAGMMIALGFYFGSKAQQVINASKRHE